MVQVFSLQPLYFFLKQMLDMFLSNNMNHIYYKSNIIAEVLESFQQWCPKNFQSPTPKTPLLPGHIFEDSLAKEICSQSFWGIISLLFKIIYFLSLIMSYFYIKLKDLMRYLWFYQKNFLPPW